MRLAQLPKQPIQIAKLAGGGAPVILRPGCPLPGGMSLVDINSKLPKQPVPRAQIGNASPVGGVKPLGAKSPIKVVAIAGPGSKKATPVTLQAAGALALQFVKNVKRFRERFFLVFCQQQPFDFWADHRHDF